MKPVYKLLFISFALFLSCSDYKQQHENVVKVHMLSEPDMLLPLSSMDVNAGYVISHVFMPLLLLDFNTLELIPALAETMPRMEKMNNGKLKYHYTIRKEAVWDDGKPITAMDVLFTIKAIKNPKVNNAHQKPFFEFITEFELDSLNNKKFAVFVDSIYMNAELSSGDFHILPEHIYDPKSLMRKFSLHDLSFKADSLSDLPEIIEFANDMNSEKRMREKEFISGCGPYAFDGWETGKNIVLSKKKNWWGEKYLNENSYFEVYPEKIIYTFIKDHTAAITALKAGNIDVMYNIKPKDFQDIKKSSKINEMYNLHTPEKISYSYIVFNLKNKILSDKKVRVAFSKAININRMISTIMYGEATPTIGFIRPSDKLNYNSSIEPYNYNITEAKQLLADAGWKDSDGDGILDKVIEGKKHPMVLTFMYNTENDIRKSITLMSKEDLEKLGVKINVVTYDWSVCLEKLIKHDFEISTGDWIYSPISIDPKQVFHTTTYNNGSNFGGFGTAATDALIDSLRVELDKNARSIYYKKLQEVIHEEAPYVFLWTGRERIAINKKFDNVKLSSLRPGFNLTAFKLKQN